MRFSMIKITRSGWENGTYTYESMIMERGASQPWKNTFDSEYELVAILNDILARQKRCKEVGRVLDLLRRGEHYFFDLDLTREQAESLGWNDVQPVFDEVG
ncbi:MAG TPA: hypothetical protein VMX38_11025 [Verrucomicrobiae bacterium]|nr:hypothetical protein [Verrucomicrobiae bacterium]